MRLRICVVSEAIRKPFDEGVKLFVYNLIKELSKNHFVLGLGRSNNFKGDIEEYCSKAIPLNKLFLGLDLKRKIRDFKPDIIYYIPPACATIFTFLRAKILKIYSKGSKTVIITLQPREYSTISRKIIPFIVPDLVFAQSEKTQKVLASLGCNAKNISIGVDLQKFKPVSNKDKERLKKKYKVPFDKYIVLHIGHINRNRNAQIMERVQSINGMHAMIVGSKSYPEDSDLVSELKQKGVTVITNYIKNIEEIYQCADCYLFPVFSHGACIEIPLSIFEAMACNLPVITTRFGGLNDLIAAGKGFVYADNNDDLLQNIKSIKKTADITTRMLAQNYSWEKLTEQIVLAS